MVLVTQSAALLEPGLCVLQSPLFCGIVLPPENEFVEVVLKQWRKRNGLTVG